MNINPTSKKVLCFGDSNTWGRNPQEVNLHYPANVRWTGVLQQKLGENFEVIEEGLQGRTTNLDDPSKPGRSGKDYLLPCLQSHTPLDVVVLMLGTNDMKEKFHRAPDEIAQAIAELITVVKTVAIDDHAQSPHIIVVSPPLVQEAYLKADTKFKGASGKSQELPAYIKEAAQQLGVHFIDISRVAQTGITDGVHLEVDGHASVAAVVYEKVKEVCPSS